MRRWLAGLLCPDMAKNADRYWYLRTQISTVHRWLNGEGADVAQYLMDQEADHWRPLNAPAGARNTPWEIGAFREWLYRKRS